MPHLVSYYRLKKKKPKELQESFQKLPSIHLYSIKKSPSWETDKTPGNNSAKELIKKHHPSPSHWFINFSNSTSLDRIADAFWTGPDMHLTFDLPSKPVWTDLLCNYQVWYIFNLLTYLLFHMFLLLLE